MDRRLRELERRAATGDAFALQQLGLARCRMGHHDWSGVVCQYCEALRCDVGECIWNNHECYSCGRFEPSKTLMESLNIFYSRVRKGGRSNWLPAASLYLPRTDKEKGRSKRVATARGWLKGTKKAPKGVSRKIKKRGLLIDFAQNITVTDKVVVWGFRDWKKLDPKVRTIINGMRWYPGS